MELAPAMILQSLPDESRLFWFGSQEDWYGRGWDRQVRVAARRVVLDATAKIDAVGFPLGDDNDMLRSVTLGGETLFVGESGQGRGRLRTERARSWVDWFVRVRPRRTWKAADHRTDNFVPVEDDEIGLPWSHELFGSEGRTFRRQFLPFGSWQRLHALGAFHGASGATVDATDSTERDEPDWQPDREEAAGTRIRAIQWNDLASLREGTFDPTLDEGHYVLSESDRDQWQELLLNEGDLVFGGTFDGQDELSHHVAPITAAAAGSIADIEDGVEWFTFHDDTPDSVRQWVTAFLLSPLGDRWARVLKYHEGSEFTWWSWRWPDFLIPIPDPHWLRAYVESEEAEARLEEGAQRIRSLRSQVFDVQPEGTAAWNRLRNVRVRASVVNRILHDIGGGEFTVRFLHPYPLANGLRRVQTTPGPPERLRRIVQLGELTAGVLVGFWVTLELSRTAGLPAPAAATLRARLRRGLTFGGLLQLVQHHLIPAFQQCALAPYIDVREVEAADRSLQHLNDLRNDLSHNRLPEGRPAAEVVGSAEASAREALAALESLAVLQLVRLETVDADPVTRSCRSFTGRALAGDHPAGWPIEDSDPPSAVVLPGHLYLRTPERVLTPASPMFSLDPEAADLGLGLLVETSERGAEYRQVDSGHTWIDPDAVEHLPG